MRRIAFALLALAVAAVPPALAGPGVYGALQSSYDAPTVSSGDHGTTVSTGDTTVSTGSGGTQVSTGDTTVSTGSGGTQVSTGDTTVSTGDNGTTVSTGDGTTVSTGGNGTTVSTGGNGTTVSTGDGTTVGTGGGTAATNPNIEKMFAAASRGDLQTVNAMLNEGVSVHAVDASKRTLLHYAAKFQQPDVATIAVNRGAVVHARDESDLTPLMQAAISNNAAVARMLIDAGADPHAVGFRSGDGSAASTALILAAEMGSVAVAKLLLDKGANPNYVNNFNRTALFWAEKAGQREMVDLLRRSGATVGGIPGSSPGGSGAAVVGGANGSGTAADDAAATRPRVNAPIAIGAGSRLGSQRQAYDEKLVRYVLAALTLGANLNFINRNRGRDTNYEQALLRFNQGVRAANAAHLEIRTLDGEPMVVRKGAAEKPVDGWEVILTSDEAAKRLGLE